MSARAASGSHLGEHARCMQRVRGLIEIRSGAPLAATSATATAAVWVLLAGAGSAPTLQSTNPNGGLETAELCRFRRRTGPDTTRGGMIIIEIVTRCNNYPVEVP